jgi:hypothetical protein
MGRMIDFDAARAEARKEPLVLRAFGQEFELPPAMPAGLFLDLLALESGDASAEVSYKDAIQLLGHVLPKDVLEQLRNRPDFTIDELSEMSGMVIQAYMGRAPEPRGEAPAPSRKPSK